MIFDLLKDEPCIIKVIGVGGGGSNAVNHMFRQGIVGVDFAICNTDEQAMEISPVPKKIALGPELTDGRGAGSKPNVGRQACLESIEEIRAYLSDGTKMLFITAGMGGGTGTGAAPIIAKVAQELGILTVGIVTLPFTFEGNTRIKHGIEGLDDLQKNVDSLIVISNDKLRQIYGNLKLSDAFTKADNILLTAAKGIAEIITVPGYVNVDFEDVNTTMRSSGVAIMGTAIAEGDDRAKRAVDEALNSPLLEENCIKGARNILLNITSGIKEVTMDEIFEITEFVQEEAGHGTNLIWGNCFDENLGDAISVTVIATGFEANGPRKLNQAPKHQKTVVSLDDDEPRKRTIADLGAANHHDEPQRSRTVEFEDLPQRYNRSTYDPYVREDKEEEERRKYHAREQARREKERQRNANMKFNNPGTMSELENTPAYLRRRISLDDPGTHDAREYSQTEWQAEKDGEEGNFNTRNTFLHDKVD